MKENKSLNTRPVNKNWTEENRGEVEAETATSRRKDWRRFVQGQRRRIALENLRDLSELE